MLNLPILRGRPAAAATGATETLVSVVIPTLNEAGSIEAVLAAARSAYSADQLEIVVVDGGSVDGTLALVPDGEVVAGATPGRAAQMNRGAALAGGRVLVFVHADTMLPPRWREEVLSALAQHGVVGGCFRPVFRPARGFLHVLNALAYFPLYPAAWLFMYGDQATFMHRATFERVGGFREQPLMEDLEMARALSRQGRTVRLHSRAVTSSRRFLQNGPLRQQLLNLSLVARYLIFGAGAADLAGRYQNAGTQA
jgi:rSAM/selenodomain-associated transferase 2